MNKSGFLLYNKEDYSKNKRFADLLIEYGKASDFDLSVLFTEDLSFHTGDYSLSEISDTLSERHPFVCKQRTGELRKPDLIINRSRNAQAAEAFEKNGVRVFNSSKVCRIANDKDETKRYLNDFGVSGMEYIVLPLDKLFSSDPVYEEQPLLSRARAFGYPFVTKPENGHGGNLVRRIGEEASFSEYLTELKSWYSSAQLRESRGDADRKEAIVFPQKLLLERVASDIGKDLRVYVLGNQILAAMLRESRNNELCANFSLGGTAVPHTLTKKEQTLTERIISALPSDFIGIDFIYHNGEPVFNEIEDAVGCRMLYAFTDLDPAKEFMAYISASLLPHNT